MSFIIEDNYIQEKKLKGNELLLFAIINSYGKSSNGCCWASRRTLSNMIGCDSVRTIDATLKSLINKKLIRKTFVEVNGQRIPAYLSVAEKTFEQIREKYEHYILQEFSSVAHNLYFKDALFSYLGDRVTLTIKKKIPFEFLNKISQQNDFFNMQNKTGFIINVLVEG